MDLFAFFLLIDTLFFFLFLGARQLFFLLFVNLIIKLLRLFLLFSLVLWQIQMKNFTSNNSESFSVFHISLFLSVLTINPTHMFRFDLVSCESTCEKQVLTTLCVVSFLCFVSLLRFSLPSTRSLYKSFRMQLSFCQILFTSFSALAFFRRKLVLSKADYYSILKQKINAESWNDKDFFRNFSFYVRWWVERDDKVEA